MRQYRMHLSKALTCVLVACVCTSTNAAVRHYKANDSASSWMLSTDTRLQCGLSHDIPRFGKVLFTSYAGKKPNMEFELDMLRLPENYSFAQVTSMAPAFRPGVPTKTISRMDLKKQFNPDVPEKAAWTMLTELEKGFIPTIYYADWHNPYDKIAVGLSNINFLDNYEKFLHCRSNLLTYSFEDIAYTILNYQSNTAELSKSSKKRLAQIGEYLKHSPEIDEIAINAYTDSYGGRWPNMELSKKRARVIKDYLTSVGVEASRVKVTGFGEKRHVASNKTELGRATNRRVVITMAKP